MEKMSNEEVGQYIANEGLGYAIQYGISASMIEDKKLADMWKKAESILEDIDIYLSEHIEW